MREECKENYYRARDLSQECQLDTGGGILQHSNEVLMGRAPPVIIIHNNPTQRLILSAECAYYSTVS